MKPEPLKHELDTRSMETSSPSDGFEIDETIDGHQESETVKHRELSGSRIGNYLLERRLGEGGFGTVWQAEQEEPIRRRVALKILKLGMDSREVVARFSQERQSLAVMDHPGIAKVFDAGVTDTGRPYFVMELVAGKNLNAYCDSKNLGVRQRLELFIQVCFAVQHAHQKGIIHRDLKSSNILVVDTDNGPQPKVIDFGIAKAMTSTGTDVSLHTQIGQFIGTPVFMSPEQAEGRVGDIDTRSDVYSLGVVLYELLTGCLPFEVQADARRDYEYWRRKIVETIPAKPSTRIRLANEADKIRIARSRNAEPTRWMQTVRGDLDWIVMKAIEKDRDRRYDSVSAFGDDIKRHLANEPVAARPPSIEYVLRRFVRRHRGPVLAATALIATMILGLIVTTVMFFREKQARADAETSATKSKHVAKLLKEMLESAGPSKAQGRDSSMLKEILDKTAQHLADELKDFPDVEVELRDVLGRTYEDLGEFQSSLAQARRATELSRRYLPANDRRLAGAFYNLALSLDLNDELEDADAAVCESISIYSKSDPIDRHRLALAKDLRAWVLCRMGELEQGEQESREAVELFKEVEDRDAYAAGLSNLGNIVMKRAKMDESVRCLREATAISREILGTNHPAYVTGLNNLGHSLIALGEYEEAERLAREALEIDQRLYHNKNSSNTDAIYKILACCLAARQEWDGAIALLQKAVSASSEVYSADHRFTTDKRSLLALTQLAAGQVHEAEKTLAEARELGCNKSADHSIGYAAAMIALARNDLETAEREARESYEKIASRSQSKTIDLADPLKVWAEVKIRKQEWLEAQRLLNEALSIMLPELNPRAPKVVQLKELMTVVSDKIANP